MKLERAIEIGSDNVKAKPPGMNHDYFEALQLLVEAGKRCQELRSPTNYAPMRPLPGETE